MLSREKEPVHMVHVGHCPVSAVESVDVFRALVPFDQAALPDNQKIANIVVIIKSANGISLLLL